MSDLVVLRRTLSGPLSFFVSEFMLSIDHDPALLPSPVTAASAN
jgi:hypothetical protein